MYPAFKIPLTKEQLALLGEIVVIQGQIEYIVNEATSIVLSKPISEVEKIYGAAPLARRIADFVRYARGIHEPSSFQAHLTTLTAGVDALLGPRNSFVHAVYGYTYSGIGAGRVLHATDPTGRRNLSIYTDVAAAPLSLGAEPTERDPLIPIAFRTANNQLRADPSDLVQIRDQFAGLSQAAGRLWHALKGLDGEILINPPDNKLWKAAVPKPIYFFR